MKALLHAVAARAVVFLGWQLWRQIGEYRADDARLQAMTDKLRPVAEENVKLAEDLKSLESRDTMLRELRRAGYAAPGEKVIVIVPKK